MNRDFDEINCTDMMKLPVRGKRADQAAEIELSANGDVNRHRC